ncbi:GLPGLI family protein [Chryseobacterium sp. OV279]|uniref:GLPGLI family protein n=1 Tax=Chryseobacterium sp. OV279 TaxID=1500285 RepID=UPI00091D0972|nr:GLPGLI family protein [Chryseobacterium sp. OV279]SHF86221.1 GLPGLI family protein [Chryseobacterium sp. OV279]
MAGKKDFCQVSIYSLDLEMADSAFVQEYFNNISSKMYRLLFLLWASFFSAQSYRFVYEYKMKPDAAKKDSVITDYMNLDTDGKKSYFQNGVKYERDSTYNADKSYPALLKSRQYDRNLNYTVEKDYAQKTINFYDKYKTVSIITSDNEAPKWKIVNDFKKINKMNCQKAVADYKGRKWEAWFSKDFPVSDGPYKFTGLPGLVVSVKDSENDHVFDLVQIKKISTVTSFIPKNNKQMTHTEYRKLIKNYTFTSADDIAGMNVDSKAGVIGLELKDGYVTKLDYNELKKSGKQMDALIAKKLRMTNNPIEKD